MCTHTLYRPTEAEIDALLRPCMARADAERRRMLAKAGALLAAGAVRNYARVLSAGPRYEADWQVASTRYPGRWYDVARHPQPGCTCPYCRREDAIGGRRNCAHLVAFLAYWRLVEDRLTELVEAGAVSLRNLHAGRPEMTPTYVPVGLPACRVERRPMAHGWRCVLPEAHDLDVVAYALAGVGERVAVMARSNDRGGAHRRRPCRTPRGCYRAWAQPHTMPVGRILGMRAQPSERNTLRTPSGLPDTLAACKVGAYVSIS